MARAVTLRSLTERRTFEAAIGSDGERHGSAPREDSALAVTVANS